MASLRAHVFDLMVRYGVKWRLGRSPDIERIREVFGQEGIPPASFARFASGEIGGIHGEWAEGLRPCTDLVLSSANLLYVHGGGFVGGSPLTHRPITGAFARAGFSVFAPDYRLAPEHPFPAAIEDVVAAWAALSATGPAALAGNSAGGNLALVLIGEARRRGLPMPIAAALFSPVCDLAQRGRSFRRNGFRDAMFGPRMLESLVQAYLAGADPRDPRASPIEQDFSGFPPLLVHVAERELLRSNSLALVEKARAAGVRVQLKVWPVVPHGWQLAETLVPEGRRSLVEAAVFLRDAFADRIAAERDPTLGTTVA